MTTIERRPNIVGLLVALAALVAGGVVWVAARSSGEGEAVASTVWAATSTVSARVVPNSSAPTAPATTVVVDTALPSASGVVLFAHSFEPDAVLRIEVDRGAVVTTAVGPVMSTAPAFLAVGPSVAVVRPYDNVRGYVVADSGAVSEPSGLLGGGTFMTCSDGRRDRVWLDRGTLVQVDYRGLLTAQIGGADRPSAIGCDGAGEMLYRIGNNTLVTGDGPPTPITSNTLVAAGPRTFLVRDCAAAAACSLTVVDRPTGERRSLTLDFALTTPQSFPVQPEGRLGSISPDGHSALLFRAQSEPVFVDLASGAAQGGIPIVGVFQSLVWSTDSRYLFFIGGGYKLWAFDRETRNLKPLGINNVLALASRPS